jgi:hypothetical protein
MPYKFCVNGSDVFSNSDQSVFVILLLQHDAILHSLLAETSPHFTQPSYFAVLHPVIFHYPRRGDLGDVFVKVVPRLFCFLWLDFLPSVDRFLLIYALVLGYLSEK